MSGAQLVAALARAGYPGSAELEGSALEWMMELPGLQPVLEWLSQELGPHNMLTTQQFNAFADLRSAGEVILEGEQLETALQSSHAAQPRLTVTALQQEIAELEEEVRLTHQRHQMLLHHRNKLALHESALSERTTRLHNVERAAQGDYTAALQQAHADSAKVKESVAGLSDAVCQLTALYRPPASPPGTEAPNQRAAFLSQCDLQAYHHVEEKFTEELTAYTKRLFFEGIARVSGEAEATRYELLEVSEPAALLVVGEKQSIKLDDCRELARLQASYPGSERARINSVLRERGLQAACDVTHGKLDALKQLPYPKEGKLLRDKVAESEAVLGVLQRDEARLVQHELPRLLQDCTAAQVTRILRGDYDLKISRQDYFISNQQKVIDELVVQRTRNELLTMAYEVEERCHRDVHKLLTATNLLLQRHQRHSNQRMALMREPGLQAARHQRNTVDSRHHYLAALNTMLEEDSRADGRQQLFVTYDSLTQHAGTLSQKVTAHRAAQSAARGARHTRLHAMEEEAGRCEALVYCGASGAEGQPGLSPQRLADAITQLDGLLHNLEQVVMDVIKDVDAKKKAVKGDALLGMERELMLYFHTDPQRLRRVIHELAARLQASTIT